jgi:hypothetical protein
VSSHRPPRLAASCAEPLILSIRSSLGWLFIGLSALCVVQSAREWRAWTPDPRLAERDLPLALPIEFAGHRVTVADNLPTDSVSSEREFEGRLQLFLDGRPLGAPSRAFVRPGRRDLGRYHTWLQVSRFHDRETGRDILFLARRIEPRTGGSVRFEVNRIDANGTVTTQLLHPWSLGRRYPVWRATQFLRANEWETFPLSMLEALGFPVFLVIFPVGTLIAGVVLVWFGRRLARSTASA